MDASYKKVGKILYLWDISLYPMSVTKIDEKYRVPLDKKVRKASGLKKGERLVTIPFRRGVILRALDGKSFERSLLGFKYVEEEHEASRYLFKG
jgi:bifunctional DNA-binding transcriptional regulator/antitoxin component of YhaV-PrlF toxin-antitoxin module